jgi:hypothetical protein
MPRPAVHPTLSPKPPRFHLVQVGRCRCRHYTGSMLRDALPKFTARNKRAPRREQAAATSPLVLRARMDEPVSKRPYCALKRKYCGATPVQAAIKRFCTQQPSATSARRPSSAEADLYESRAAACAMPKPTRISAACP